MSHVIHAIIEKSSRDWDMIGRKRDTSELRVHFEMTFKEAWKDLLTDEASPHNIVAQLGWRTPLDKEQLARLYERLQPIFVEQLENAIVEDRFDGDLYEENLHERFTQLSDDFELNSILSKLRTSHRNLCEIFLTIFNLHFFESFVQYQTAAEETAEYQRRTHMQLYKLHVTLPLDTHRLWSQDAAKRIYNLLKIAVARGILKNAKFLKGLATDEVILLDTLDERRSRYSQITLYLPDPLDVTELTTLIHEINIIAAEEGVGHNSYEQSCDTHISGVVSLRYDYVRGDKYLPADEVTPQDLEKQNALPIIKELQTDGDKYQKEQKCWLAEYTQNKQLLLQFYNQLTPAMSKASSSSEKGKVFNNFANLLQVEGLKKYEVEYYLKLLLKIILQRNRMGFYISTDTGNRALALLATPEFSLLKGVVTEKNGRLNYQHLIQFTLGKNPDPLFFSARNKVANIKECDTEIVKLTSLLCCFR